MAVPIQIVLARKVNNHRQEEQHRVGEENGLVETIGREVLVQDWDVSLIEQGDDSYIERPKDV